MSKPSQQDITPLYLMKEGKLYSTTIKGIIPSKNPKYPIEIEVTYSKADPELTDELILIDEVYIDNAVITSALSNQALEDIQKDIESVIKRVPLRMIL